MNEIELETIQEEVNARYYISPIMAYQYLKFLLSHIHSLEEKVKELQDEIKLHIINESAQKGGIV